MLCSVYESNNAVFIFVGLFCIGNLLPKLFVGAALPSGAEDELVVIEHLPGRRVHLQDFFWTGSEDAPPWLDPDQTLRLYEPRTVHHTATIYLPGGERVDSEDPGCSNCIDPTPTLSEVDQDIGILIGDDPGPRYWLLTVLRAGETVPPRVELRLARLYRAAFMRQQRRHLGLLSTVFRAKRTARRHLRRQIRRKRSSQRLGNAEFGVASSVKFENETETGTKMRSEAERSSTGRPEVGKVTRMRAVRIVRRDEAGNDKADGDARGGVNLSTNVDDSINGSSNTREEGGGSLSKSPAKLRALELGKVQVRMQNTSISEDGRPRLVYSVHLGGEPVPAASAARDMALLSEQEVALELGAPVVIQSEPYLKETIPLALSRRRDAWLLISAAAAGLMLLILVVVGLIIGAKRKKARSSIAAPPPQSILKRQREYASTTPGLDNTGYTSETDPRTDGTSQRASPGSQQRSPFTPGTPETVAADIHDDLSEDEAELKRARIPISWDEQEYPEIVDRRQRPTRRRVLGRNDVESPPTPDSMDGDAEVETVVGNGNVQHIEVPKEEATTSPHSYLSMPSCKQFPTIRSVEPLSRVLEPVVVRHLDLDLDSPEMLRKHEDYDKCDNQTYLIRSSSAINDPGVVGPIVWDLRRQKAIDETTCSEGDLERVSTTGPVGRARRRLHELLEDSFSLFGSREAKVKESACQLPSTKLPSPKYIKMPTESRGKSATVSPVVTPETETKARPRTSLPRRGFGESIEETGNSGPHPRGAWGSRPLSAGPFHRPNLPEVDTVRVLADSRLPPEDPAVPLIAAIKKELEKFSPDPNRA